LWADLPTDLWAIQPTGREVTDFKKAVSVRVNSFTICFSVPFLVQFGGSLPEKGKQKIFIFPCADLVLY
jgi:hypothetical protein